MATCAMMKSPENIQYDGKWRQMEIKLTEGSTLHLKYKIEGKSPEDTSSSQAKELKKPKRKSKEEKEDNQSQVSNYNTKFR